MSRSRYHDIFPFVVAAACIACGFTFVPRAAGEAISLANPSFERGTGTPAGWTLSAGEGEWLEGDVPDGNRAVSVTGDGEGTNYWRTGPLPFKPSTLYYLRFHMRVLDAAGGTPITGPVFANRDYWGARDRWEPCTSLFISPSNLNPDNAWLRFGQWHLDGRAQFDAVELSEAQAAHRERDGIVLGRGEKVTGTRYSFIAPLSEGTNYSRPLEQLRCGFNTSRFVFGADSSVTFRHRIGNRNQSEIAVNAAFSWYGQGALAILASTDGANWTQLGSLDGESSGPWQVPESMVPAKEVWVKLAARTEHALGTDSDPGSYQVGRYTFTSTLDGTPITMFGATDFVAVTQTDERVRVEVETLGDASGAGGMMARLRLTNTANAPIQAAPSITVTQDGADTPSKTAETTLEPGENLVEIPYSVPGAGAYRLAIDLGGDLRYAAWAEAHMPILYEQRYGERLPGDSEDVGLWTASPGWKVARTRTLPETKTNALRLSAARNEAEAVQLIVRPARALKGLRVGAGSLNGPQLAQIPADSIDVLRVMYLDIEQKTDAAGAEAPWPDPLPPLAEPLDLEAGQNQPLWVRVKAPRGIPAGMYRGTVELRAQGWQASVPLEFEVYDFDLPHRMTCVTAFGFSPGTAFSYHGVEDPAQQRELLAKYWQTFSDHHISPYDPAPLDPLGVSWKGGSEWSGGQRDKQVKRSGESSLLLRDDSKSAGVSSACNHRIPIPDGGLRLRFWHRASEPDHPTIVTLTHYNAAGVWLSGRNNDMQYTSGPDWQEFDRTVRTFPEGATTLRVTLRPALWSEPGETTGTMWFDDLTLTDAAAGTHLVEGGGFEPVPPDIEPVFDWAAWDQALDRAFSQYHFTTFRLGIPGMGGGTFHSRTEPSLLGYAEDTPQYQSAFNSYCSQMEAHLRENGWLDEAYVYWFDEPDPKDYEFVMNGFRKLKEAAPDIKRMLTEQVEPELVGGPNIWCPVSHHFDLEDARERMEQGEVFWWYVCTGPKEPYATLFIDHPGTEMRVWLWQTWKRDISGILVWTTNYWTSTAAYPGEKQNPYEDPMSWTSGYSTPAGTKRPWGNGDGRFLYPPLAAAGGNPGRPVMDPPVECIRWEMLRDGIEDYEYFAILERLLGKKGASLAADERAEYERLLEVPGNVSESMVDFTFDPAPMEAHRAALAEAIAELRKK